MQVQVMATSLIKSSFIRYSRFNLSYSTLASDCNPRKMMAKSQSWLKSLPRAVAIAGTHPQDAIHRSSLHEPETFWDHHAKTLHWHKQPSRALLRVTKALAGGASHKHWCWFPNGEISTTYNCVDRHVENGNGDNVAIIWESPVTGQKAQLTYRQLYDEVEVLAGVLREEGVQKGDVVLIYSRIFP
jgi:Acetyl-coenzyme A synthetase N-terminus/AMP-binding enzyme